MKNHISLKTSANITIDIGDLVESLGADVLERVLKEFDIFDFNIYVDASIKEGKAFICFYEPSYDYSKEFWLADCVKKNIEEPLYEPADEVLRLNTLRASFEECIKLIDDQLACYREGGEP